MSNPLDLSTTAPAWARKLAEQAVRDRDLEPAETWCSTPRSEEGEKDDLVAWMRTAELVVEAGEKGRVSKRQWIRWGEFFDSIPGVGEYFRQLLKELPRKHGPQKAKGKRMELATAIQKGFPCVPWSLWVLPGPEWWWQDYYARLSLAWALCAGLPGGAHLQPFSGRR